MTEPRVCKAPQVWPPLPPQPGPKRPPQPVCDLPRWHDGPHRTPQGSEFETNFWKDDHEHLYRRMLHVFRAHATAAGWFHEPQAFLAGRTPLQAIADGDADAVDDIIAHFEELAREAWEDS